MMPCDGLRLILLCAQCSQDTFWIHGNPEQNTVVTENELMNDWLKCYFIIKDNKNKNDKINNNK